MDYSRALQNIKDRQYVAILQSDGYHQLVEGIVNRISVAATEAVNEATIESYFDCELFAFFRTVFEPLGYAYNPVKEQAIATKRHVAKGRADSAIGALVIEFKHYTKLCTPEYKKEAVNQISEYLLGLYAESKNYSLGLVTDGNVACYVQQIDGEITVENFEKLNFKVIDRLIKNIILLSQVDLNADNLVKDFCLPSENSIISVLTMSLYKTLHENMHPKTEMLFEEWKELFKLAHNDISKQQAIIDRKQALQTIVNDDFNSSNDEYLALYALQTTYAIIVKIVAFKVVSKVRYNADLIEFESLLNTDSNSLRSHMAQLEDGAIFRSYKITNLLEGDFFSWYVNEDQWSDVLCNAIKKVFSILSKYADKAVTTDAYKSQDFFKLLYIKMIPDAVRHSLGEYYTKKWLAKQVVDEAVRMANVSGWKGLEIIMQKLIQFNECRRSLSPAG